MPDKTTYFELAALFLVSLGSAWLVYNKSNSFKEAAGSLQAVLTAAAIMIAGYWYIVERKGHPHADIMQTIDVVGLNNGYVALEATISIKNLGLTVLRPSLTDIRLQQVAPFQFPVRALIGTSREDWPDHVVVNGTRKLAYFGSELMWPVLKHFSTDPKAEIEPGETDRIVATFIVPCSLHVVRVESAVEKSSSEALWWRTQSFAKLDDACTANRVRERHAAVHERRAHRTRRSA